MIDDTRHAMTPPKDREALVEVMREAAHQEEQLYLQRANRTGVFDQHELHARMASASLAALEAAGVAFVPVVATKAMIQAAGASPGGVSVRGGIDWLGRMLPRYWAAMVAKTPYAQPHEALKGPTP